MNEEKPLHVRVAEALGWTVTSKCQHCDDRLGSHSLDFRSCGVEVYIPCC